MNRLLSGEIATQYEEDEHRRYYLELRTYHVLMGESAEKYRIMHSQAASILFRTERKLRMVVSFVRSRTGSVGADLTRATFPKIEDLSQEIKLAFERLDSSDLGDTRLAHTWTKFDHKSGEPIFNSRDTPTGVIRKLIPVPVISPKYVNLIMAKTSALVGECLRLDDQIQLTEDARYEAFRVSRYVRNDLAKILRRTSHFSRKQFQCARCCLAREIKEVLNLLLRTRPHWVSPSSRESLRFCNPRVYYS